MRELGQRLAVGGAVWAILIATSCVAPAPEDPELPEIEGPPVAREIPVVAHWTMQGGVPGRPAHTNHVVRDASGNDLHGAVDGAPRFRRVQTPTGTLGLTFDGKRDRVLIPDDARFQLTESLTLEAFVEVEQYPSARQRFGQIVFRGDNRPGLDPWFLAVTNEGKLVFQIANAKNVPDSLEAPVTIPKKEMVHVAATWDGDTGIMRLYQNGDLLTAKRTKIRPMGPLSSGGPGVGIGDRHAIPGQKLQGTIAELRLASRALSVDEFLGARDG